MATDRRSHLMGTANAKAVYAVWGHLPHVAVRMLVYMAVRSYDTPSGDKPARVFWEGRESLALALGHTVPQVPDGDVPEDVLDKIMSERKAAFQAVKRTLSALSNAGAIKRIAAPRRGARAEYLLVLDRPESFPQGDTERTPQGYTERTPQGYTERTP